MLEMAMPITIEEEILGGVKVSLSQEGIKGDIKKVKENLNHIYSKSKENTIYAILLLTFSLLIIGLILSLIIVRKLTYPIKKLSRLANRIGQGEYNIKIAIKRSDEIGDLALSFTKMSDDLQKTTFSKEYVDNILESMMNSLIVVSTSGKIKKVNRATLRLLSYREGELLNQPILTIFKSRHSIDGNGLNYLIEKGSIDSIEDVYMSKEGKEIPVLFSGGTLHEKNGKIRQ